MGDNALIVQIGLGLLVIFFFVTIGFSVRSWRFAHLFFLSLTFIGTLTFTIFAAMVLKTHMAWRSEVNKLSDDLTTQVKAIDNIQFGDVTEGIVEQDPNLRSVKAEKGRITLDLGRVWKHCQPGNWDGTRVTVTTAVAPVGPVPEGAAPPAPTPNNIEAKAILYAFKEAPSADNTMLLPSFYLGEFVAEAVTESSVTLTPTIPLDAEQTREISNNDSTWVLYEVMPIDGHQFFAGLTEEQLRALIPQGKMSQETYDALITSYVRTGGPATEDDPPEYRWVKVRFLKEKTIDVDSPQMAEGELEYFDQQGRSVASRLRRGDTVRFDVGDTAIVDQATAEEWVAAGEVERREMVYMRPLNDYAMLFSDFYYERVELAGQIALVTRETASIVNSTKLAEGQVARLTEEHGKLEADQANFTAEQQAVADLETQLQARSEELRKELSATYLLNQQLAAELRQLQQQLADEVAKADASKTAAIAK